MRYEGTLTVTLKSDLCVGSGYSYAGLIDSDICFDKYGIPYIPARRLKGCLRQSAEDYLLGTIVNEADINDIFGVSGDYATKGVCFENAYPKQYEQLFQELELACKKVGIHQESILRSFTCIRGQTKLKDGIAEDNSLRYTRVLNHYSPLDGEEMVFVSRFIIHESDDALMQKLEAIAKATRQIGLKRNRGLGSVSCKLSYEPVSEETIEVSGSEKEKVICYSIQNTHPLMLSNLADTESIKYIPGQTMLGFLAGAYLRATGKSSKDASTDPVFAQLFLGGNTKYTNLVPSSGGKEYFPAPTYLNRLKTTKKYVNVINQKSLQSESYSENYDPHGGNQPKKLSGKFVSMDDSLAIDVIEVDTKMVYHHSQRGKSRGGEEGILYCMEVVEPMQEFTGRIYTREKYVPLLTELLQNGRISLGKSKSAQYGACRLLSLSVKDASEEITHDGTIVVTFCSDGIFLNDNGEYTVYEDEIYDLIARDLGIQQFIDRTKKDAYPSMLSTKEVVGYQSTWNLRRMPVPAICAGSCVIYHLKEKASVAKNMVGERNHEGYGLVRVDPYQNMMYEVKLQEVEIQDPFSQSSEDKLVIRVGHELLQGVLLDSVMDSMKESGMLQGKSICKGISPSTLGRITLMLKESLSINENSQTAKEDFFKRINSIKTDGARKEGNKIFDAVTNMSKSLCLNQEQKELASLLGLSQEMIQEMIDSRWGEYAMTMLTHEKYQKSAGKGE
ncbi:MAG: RAMP superfamily CRISPR-associated protein [Lachnospiraceae bacterium]|nr:RAMP superfamily CRISPR-associated protein [Lachnospiraceae bacterium]